MSTQYSENISKHSFDIFIPNVIVLLYRWQKIFSFNVWGKIATFWNKAFLSIIVLLIVLFLGKYSIPPLNKLTLIFIKSLFFN